MRKKAFTVKTTPSYMFGLAMLLPLVFYYLTVFIFAVNIPLSDDFPTILGFLGSFLSLESFSDKIRLLFSQHNEHRIVFNRLTTLAVYKMNGVLDFKLLILAGNILLLPALYAVYISFRKTKDKLKYFLPAVLIVMVPQFTGSMFWATSVMQNISCLAFSLLALALLKREGTVRALTAFSFAVLAVFSSGNGLFVFPVILIFLLLKKRKKAALGWGSAALIILLFYFYGYNAPLHDKVYYGTNPLSMLEFFFVFIGSPIVLNVFYMKSLLGANAEVIMRLTSAIFGGAIAAYFLFLIKKKYYRDSPVIFSIFILFFLSGVAAAITRSGIGPMQVFASRYRIIPVFIFALVYLSFIEITKEKTAEKYYKYLLIFAVLFSALSYIANIPEIRSCRDNLATGMTAWKKDGSGLQRLSDNPAYAAEQLRYSVEKGLYRP